MTIGTVLAVLVAAASSFALGGLWYSKALFLGPWQRAAGIAGQAEMKHAPSVFAISFGFCLVAAAAFAWWIGPNPPLGDAVLKGLIVGVCFVAATFGINYQFAGRSMTLWLIDAGYHVVQFLLFGLVLGLLPKIFQ
jgi:hypothetical protein